MMPMTGFLSVPAQAENAESESENQRCREQQRDEFFHEMYLLSVFLGYPHMAENKNPSIAFSNAWDEFQNKIRGTTQIEHGSLFSHTHHMRRR